MVQWLRLCAPDAEDPGSIPGQGTRSFSQGIRQKEERKEGGKKKKGKEKKRQPDEKERLFYLWMTCSCGLHGG